MYSAVHISSLLTATQLIMDPYKDVEGNFILCKKSFIFLTNFISSRIEGLAINLQTRSHNFIPKIPFFEISLGQDKMHYHKYII